MHRPADVRPTSKPNQWQVQAFEVEDPSRQSGRSDPWNFTIASDGHTQIVFEDRFDEDLGWDVDGDALTGAWTRGDPSLASHMGELSQPGDCIGGTSCYFTGHNAGGVPDNEDVGGGSTTLISPPFDLSGAVTATVQLQRFFYESEAGGASLRVELLIPDGRAPRGVAVHELELLEQTTAVAAENRWTPREYAACGLPMVEGSQLRITATDLGAGILEAAIDSVSVHAHSGAAVCGSGEGGQCSPSVKTPCPDRLLCCGEGPLNEGVYRCREPAPGLDFENPPPDPDAPGNGPLGCPGPDLIIDESWIEPVLTDIFVSEATCELYEAAWAGWGGAPLCALPSPRPTWAPKTSSLASPPTSPTFFTTAIATTTITSTSSLASSCVTRGGQWWPPRGTNRVFVCSIRIAGPGTMLRGTMTAPTKASVGDMRTFTSPISPASGSTSPMYRPATTRSGPRSTCFG